MVSESTRCLKIILINFKEAIDSYHTGRVTGYDDTLMQIMSDKLSTFFNQDIKGCLNLSQKWEYRIQIIWFFGNHVYSAIRKFTLLFTNISLRINNWVKRAETLSGTQWG